jgi:hypothetical protein
MITDSGNRRDFLAYAGAALAGASRAFCAPPTEEARRSPYERIVLAGSPCAFWRLGESRGPVARDSSVRGIDGRYEGAVEFGQIGAIASDADKSIGLRGPRTKAYVEVPNQKGFSIATSGKGLSVEVWLRPDVLEFAGEDGHSSEKLIHWLGKGEKNEYEWGFRFYSRNSSRPNRISAYAWNTDGKLGAGAYVEHRLEAGVWIYLVATFDDPGTAKARVRLYKDGVPSPHNESPGTLYKNYDIKPRHGRAPLRLGTRDLHGFLTGGLDEIAIYPRALAAEEIASHWRIGRGQQSGRRSDDRHKHSTLAQFPGLQPANFRTDTSR